MCKEKIEIVMNSKLHDKARVVSAQLILCLEQKDDMNKLLETIVDGMRDMNKWASENDVIIGHVKGYVTFGQEAVMVSTTGDDIQTKGSQNMPELPCNVTIGLAAIVFGTELRETEKQLLRLITRITAHFGYEPTIIHEGEHVHDDNCGCGAHHHHHEHSDEHGQAQHHLHEYKENAHDHR